MKLKNIGKLFTVGGIALIMAGCTGSRYNLHNNGLYYEANSHNCPKSTMNKDRSINCYDKEGKYLAKRYPVSQAAVQNQRMIEQQQAASAARSLDNLNATLAYQNRTNALMYSNLYRPYGYWWSSIIKT